MEEDASRQLFEVYYMKLYSYLIALTRDKPLAEEIAQDTFYRAITTERSFRGESSEFTWLCTIARNLFYDELRRRSRQGGEIPEDVADTGDSPEERYESKEMSFRVHLALHALEEPYKEVFSLRVFGELSFAQIGAVFGKTENWARVTYHRAKLKIQERIGIHENQL